MGDLDLSADGAEEAVAARLSALRLPDAVTAAGLTEVVDALRAALARG
jgi:hypothetical protein